MFAWRTSDRLGAAAAQDPLHINPYPLAAKKSSSARTSGQGSDHKTAGPEMLWRE